MLMGDLRETRDHDLQVETASLYILRLVLCYNCVLVLVLCASWVKRHVAYIRHVVYDYDIFN